MKLKMLDVGNLLSLGSLLLALLVNLLSALSGTIPLLPLLAVWGLVMVSQMVLARAPKLRGGIVGGLIATAIAYTVWACLRSLDALAPVFFIVWMLVETGVTWPETAESSQATE